MAQLALDQSLKEMEEHKAERVDLIVSELPARKPPGTKGRQVKGVVNMFPVQWKAAKVYQYLVKFPEDLATNDLVARRKYFYQFRDQIGSMFPFYSFDNTNTLISTEQRDARTLTASNGSVLSISLIKSTDTKDARSQEMMAVVNKVFKGFVRAMKLINFGRSYYIGDPRPLEGQISVFAGFGASVLPLTSGFELNVELAHRVVHQLTVREQMLDISRTTKARAPAGGAEVSKMVIQNIRSELQGCVIVTKHNKAIYRIDDIDFTKNYDSKFDTKEGQVSFRQYYMNRYGIKLEGDGKGLITYFPRRGENMDPIYLIPELCWITGVNEKMKSSARLMKSLAQLTRIPASERINKITGVIRQLLTSPAVQAEMKNTPLTFSPVPLEVNSRILGPFTINSARGGRVTIDENHPNFQNEARRFGFFPPGAAAASQGPHKLGSWAYMHTAEFADWTSDIIANLTRFASGHGVTLPAPIVKLVTASQGRKAPVVQDWATALQSVVQTKPLFIVFLIPGMNSAGEAVYSFMKGSTIQNYGIVTQGLNSDTLSDDKRYPALMGNVVVQIMSKLGYQPWRAELAALLPAAQVGQGGCMMVGIDVQHEKWVPNAFQASPTTLRDRSTVGFVASYNHPHHSAYHSFMAFQPPRTEGLVQAEQLMVAALQAYKAKNGKFPSSVYVYRDGANPPIVQREIKLFDAAFKSLNIAVKLTVLVVEKRLNVRLFESCPIFHKTGPCKQRDGRDPCSGRQPYHSPTPGTCCDTTITSALLNDFYLTPTNAPPGATSRPTRFSIIRDDLNQSMDSMQSLAHAMCSCYFNWPGPIRVPAPAMLAHKIAFLFGKYTAQCTIHQALKDKLFYL